MNKIKPHLALLLANGIWAVNYPLYHIILPKDISALATLTLSLLIAAILSFVPLLWSRAEKVERKDILYLVIAALLSGIFRKGLVIFGLSLTSPIDASIIASLVPVTALIISIIRGFEKFSTTRLIGILLGLGGVVAIILNGNSSSEAASLKGNFLMLSYTLAAGLYVVLLQPLFKKYKAITVTRWVYVVSSLVLLPFGAEQIAHTDFSSMSHHTLLIIAFVSIVPTFLPNLMLNYALKSIPATVSSIYSYIQPILAITISVWLGLDKLHWQTLLFGAAIIAGVAVTIGSYSTDNTANTTVSDGRR